MNPESKHSHAFGPDGDPLSPGDVPPKQEEKVLYVPRVQGNEELRQDAIRTFIALNDRKEKLLLRKTRHERNIALNTMNTVSDDYNSTLNIASAKVELSKIDDELRGIDKRIKEYHKKRKSMKIRDDVKGEISDVKDSTEGDVLN